MVCSEIHLQSSDLMKMTRFVCLKFFFRATSIRECPTFRLAPLFRIAPSFVKTREFLQRSRVASRRALQTIVGTAFYIFFMKDATTFTRFSSRDTLYLRQTTGIFLLPALCSRNDFPPLNERVNLAHGFVCISRVFCQLSGRQRDKRLSLFSLNPNL